VVDGWQAEARAGRIEGVVKELLTLHYDPVYEKSMQRNFVHFAQATPVILAGGDALTLSAAAAGLAAS
jgi:tRNA 2-selenouridine synthase